MNRYLHIHSYDGNITHNSQWKWREAHYVNRLQCRATIIYLFIWKVYKQENEKEGKKLRLLYLKIIFKDLHYFHLYDYMGLCIHVYTWWLQRLEEGIDPLELESQVERERLAWLPHKPTKKGTPFKDFNFPTVKYHWHFCSIIHKVLFNYSIKTTQDASQYKHTL